MYPLPERTGGDRVGLTGTATRVVWISAVLAMVGSGVSASFDAAELLVAARQGEREVLDERLTMQTSAAVFCYETTIDRLNVTATHQGREAVEMNESEVVVDGVVLPLDSTSVDGRGATAMWSPGEIGHWFATTTTEPTRVMLVTPRGATFFAHKIVCPSFAHVQAMATYTGTTPDSTFAKGEPVTTRVTVEDQYDRPLPDATVHIEIRDPGGVLRCNCTGVTNATGVMTNVYTLPNANLRGTWTIRTTLVTGTGIYYDASANVVTQITFEES